MKRYDPTQKENTGNAFIRASAIALIIVICILYNLRDTSTDEPVSTDETLTADSLYIWHETTDGSEVKLYPETDMFEPILDHSEITAQTLKIK